MKVSVVIPMYNEEQYIAACLEALLHQTEKPDEIIVVDNNSTDKSTDIVKRYPVTLIHEKTQGITPTRNKGFNAAKYDVIARTDADTVVPPDWIKRIKKNLRGNKYVAVTGGVQFYGLPTLISMPSWPPETLTKLRPHDWLYGPNLAIKKTAWDTVKNTLCTNDKEVHEDIDLGIHLSIIGKIMYDSDLNVRSSSRRMKRLKPYIEYPYRWIKTIRSHRKTITQSQTQRIKRNIQSTKSLLKKPIQHLTDF